jgi:1,4-dihydroxy-2-naphthoyl-CoA hydrolase
MLAPNGFLHAATIVALADTSAGYATFAHLPAGADGFTTIELKTNFSRHADRGRSAAATASLVHGGRTTQVWDAEVSSGRKRTAARAFPVYADGVVAEGWGGLTRRAGADGPFG